ncbi:MULTISPECIES: flagellar biosynthesis protein FlhA [Rhodopseudomonas]|uniref:Flagellar biosynthesis protein FlhA n=2 Tax=Nitrobacteraceae TaxID=41294 RepID=A0A0D7F386_RHOPL|nr:MULTISPECIES: flagellar biosynthesis protein FlhA [Rhodopseudomonas]KIZ47534.1 flagellar biosynthesis protein FlhA [Rhodopseudomonas palustris]MDF3813156.1 flagellar biosynthesis protein FlhA [Rhodopseudomonas sp. BAL398]WOK17883.1 flagellar biosynthesis protein FlhA [Rhodopseudomonas sp. BAL398]
MSDTTAGQATGNGIPSLSEIGKILRRGDLALAFGVLTILVVLILPLPSMVLDLFLAISITLSILILMTALFIQAPLEFSSFPTILLISTMMRLSLNMASTRLILSKGHEGGAAAGHVIEAFGNFVMGGNFVIGIIVFAILVIVNFVVITKGSGRIAEVAARFHLDAMPGKQMAIDADLGAGLIDEAAAKKRRKELEDESGFFGAMDGASKFVRGDAIAGLLVVFINVIGGIIIGVAQQGLSFSEAARSYTLLTVGDGLVTQVPALIVSTAAGLLVSKAGVSGAADKALMKQLSGYPQALGMSAGVMLVLALLPGIPMLPFLIMGGGAAALAISARKRNGIAAVAEAKTAATPDAAAAAADAEEPISASLKIDDLKIELGYALLPLVNGPDGTDRLTEQIKALRRSLAVEMGFVMPAVRILDNVQLEANTYIIKIKEVDAGQGRIWPSQFMVMDPGGNQVSVPGIHTIEPTFGLPATWVDASLKEEATMKGYTVVDAATVLSTHLTELLKNNMSDLLSYGETQKLLKDLPKEQGELVKDIVPAQITVSGIQRVLQLLLAERISIRDLSTILEGVADALAISRNPSTIVEHVRARLARQICAQNTSYNGYLPLIALSAKWEQAFAESIIGQGEDRSLAMQPSKLSEFMTTVRDKFEQAAREGEAPVLVTSASIRPFVRSLVERFRAQTTVLSQAEIHPRARLKTVGSV